MVRFGIVTDLHYACNEMQINRYYSESLDKLREAVEIFNKSSLDFIVELGDLKDQGDPPEKNQTLSFLDEAEKELGKFLGPVYHVLGNHDMDSLSKSDFLRHIRNPDDTDGRTFYSFIAKGIKFVILDANFNEDGGDYDCSNYDWTVAIIPGEQIEWLKKELDCTYPVVVFVHQMLDSFSDIDKGLCIKNAPELVEIIEKNGRVLAVFQGHHHSGHYSFRQGVHYFTLKGMIEGPYPANNSFAVVEIDASLDIVLQGFGNCENRVMKRRRI